MVPGPRAYLGAVRMPLVRLQYSVRLVPFSRTCSSAKEAAAPRSPRPPGQPVRPQQPRGQLQRGCQGGRPASVGDPVTWSGQRLKASRRVGLQ